MSEIRTPPRRLADLHPRWLRYDGQPDGRIYGIQFDCPCGTPPCDCGSPECPAKDRPGCSSSRIPILFVNPPDGGPPEGVERQQWYRTGETFETLTLSPSLHLVGHWHGWCRDGVLESC